MKAWTAWQLGAALLVAAVLLGICGLAAGSQGWSFAWADEWWLITAIRGPRTLGAFLAGGLLGLAGAIAQGVFRNPLADPYLLGSASGATLAIVLVVAAGGLGGIPLGLASSAWLLRLGTVGAAFVGALAGGVLLLAADVVARSVLAPQELPVGLLTAVVGGTYLLVLLHRRPPEELI